MNMFATFHILCEAWSVIQLILTECQTENWPEIGKNVSKTITIVASCKCKKTASMIVRKKRRNLKKLRIEAVWFVHETIIQLCDKIDFFCTKKNEWRKILKQFYTLFKCLTNLNCKKKFFWCKKCSLSYTFIFVAFFFFQKKKTV